MASFTLLFSVAAKFSAPTTGLADNGIGVATELAILAATDIEHGPLECLFTVDEETGLTRIGQQL